VDGERQAIDSGAFVAAAMPSDFRTPELRAIPGAGPIHRAHRAEGVPAKERRDRLGAVVDEHFGMIACESEVGRGTTFGLRLHLRPALLERIEVAA